MTEVYIHPYSANWWLLDLNKTNIVLSWGFEIHTRNDTKKVFFLQKARDV